MKASGSSQNTSTRADVMPSLAGLSQPLFAGSPTKNGAPAISRPATDPRLHSSTAPSASLYQATARGASVTATITEMTGGRFSMVGWWLRSAGRVGFRFRPAQGRRHYSPARRAVQSHRAVDAAADVGT